LAPVPLAARTHATLQLRAETHVFSVACAGLLNQQIITLSLPPRPPPNSRNP